MTLTAETLARIRLGALGATGLVCLAYAIGALALGDPQPFRFWLPGAFGVAAALVIAGAFFRASPRAARAAHDELYVRTNDRAFRVGYWIALALYPAFGLLLANGLVGFPVAFAAMGTLTGAAYLLATAWLGLRGAM